MEFFIKKGATLPNIEVQIISNGRSDFLTKDVSFLSSNILFSMNNVKTGKSKILSNPTEIVSYENIETGEMEYYIKYQFKKRNTSETGRFEGSFFIENENGKYVLPTKDKLYINILDSFINTDTCCKPTNDNSPNKISMNLSCYYDTLLGRTSAYFVYELSSSEPSPNDVTINFTQQIIFSLEKNISFSESITLPQSQKLITKRITISDSEFLDSIPLDVIFSTVQLNPTQLSNLINLSSVVYPFLPTPSPTVTLTVTPSRSIY